MKATIIGGGSVGLLFASFLAEQGVEVTIITRRKQQAESLNHDGLLRLKWMERQLWYQYEQQLIILCFHSNKYYYS